MISPENSSGSELEVLNISVSGCELQVVSNNGNGVTNIGKRFYTIIVRQTSFGACREL